MITRQQLLDYLEEELNSSSFSDYAPNGLQVQGQESVNLICTAVTASESAIDIAIAHKAQALLVHHGYFWKGESPEIVGIKKQRLAKLLKHDINLIAYHLPLDAHAQWGNNACLGRLFEIVDCQSHSLGGIPNLLWSGELSQPYDAEQLTLFLEKKLQRKPLHLGPRNHQPIRRIAWCSGGAQGYIQQAADLGVDAYISGEVSERTYYEALELGIHYYACGHHATERYGVQALGQHLAEHFGCRHHFIDCENPV